MSFHRSLRFSFALATISALIGCGSVTTSADAGSQSSSSSSSGTKTGTPCGDAGLCAANEVCVSYDENLAGAPEEKNDAGQPIPNQGPSFIFFGTACVAVPTGCSPLACDCFTCPDTDNRGYQCVLPTDPGSPAEAVISCSQPTG